MTFVILLWLGICSWSDWKQRQVTNTITLPAIGTALLLRLFGFAEGSWQIAVGMSIIFVLGWLARIGIGGADAKVSIALALYNPQLAIWAWAGVILWYLIVKLITLGKQGPYRLPGMVGFLLGGLLLQYFTFVGRIL